MGSYQKMINDVTEVISEGRANRKNYILIGDNSSGKSDVLKNIIENGSIEAIYFIDSVNRTFDINKVQFESKEYQYMKMDAYAILRERMAPDNFNLRDTFKALSCIEQLYNKYKDMLNEMVREFLSVDIEIIREKLEAGLVENKVLIDGMDIKLSSGYQAVIRIFCELCYFREVIYMQKWESGLVIIDELDEYLSPKYSGKILNYLQKRFPELIFVITTHSIDLVKSAQNATLIVIKKEKYEIYSSEELEGTISADDVFVSLFFEDNIVHKSDDDEVDRRLRWLLNLKINDHWNTVAEQELLELQEKKLLPHQIMLCRQIEEW